MGMEVLRPQDCLIERIRLAPAIFHGRRNFYGNGTLRKVAVRPATGRPQHPKKWLNHNSSKPLVSNRSSRSNGGHLEIGGQVTILRRGEPLDSKIKADHHQPLDLESVRHSPVVSGEFLDVYAGSAFSVSPAPSSLPFPTFFNRKQVSDNVVDGDDSASRDLRRLLRLE